MTLHLLQYAEQNVDGVHMYGFDFEFTMIVLHQSP